MRGSRIIAVLALLACGLGLALWLQVRSQKTLQLEVARLRAELAALESLRAENERLREERVDPTELKRLRDGQAELIRLRGQAGQLRREAQEASAAAARAQAAAQLAVASAAPPSAVAPPSPPAQTYTANATVRAGWRAAAATGGWPLPNGKRGFVLLLPSNPGDGTVSLRTLVVQVPENLLASAGLEGLKVDGNSGNAGGALTLEQVQVLTSSFRKQEGVEIISAPQVVVASGQPAQIATSDAGATIEVVPTITPDQQGVEIVVGAQVNLPRAP
jgi:hypothetical protein